MISDNLSAMFLLTNEEAPMTRPDFCTPPHMPQFETWFVILQVGPAELSRLRRTWAVEPHAVSPRCWRWLTAP